MKKQFVRVIDGQEINVDAQRDFVDAEGNHHPRNILWLWDADALWNVLNIKAVMVEEPETQMDLFQIPQPPAPPAPVDVNAGEPPLPPEEPLPGPPPPAPPKFW